MFPETYFLKLDTYVLCIAIGVIVAFLTLYFYCKQTGVDFNYFKFISVVSALSIAVGFIFASLFQTLYNYLGGVSGVTGGTTFLGGLLGGAIFFFTVCLINEKRYKGGLKSVISILPCSLIIGHFFGRIGCFLSGCCYGTETDSFLGVNFIGLDYKVHPTQLYEAVFLLVLFIISSYLLLKRNFKYNVNLYLISYGVFRFLLEFLRGDERGSFVPGLSPSQFWCIIMVLIGVGVTIFTAVKNSKNNAKS